MKHLVAAVVFVLSACGGAGTSMPQSGVTQSASADSGPHKASSSYGDLLYVSACKGSGYKLHCFVSVLSYPGGTVLSTFSAPTELDGGACSDSNGNVYFMSLEDVYEYARGGSKPIATYRWAGLGAPPGSCSVDPTTGDLAVASSGENEFAVFQNGASGYPTYYGDSRTTGFYGCAYDDNGNLFVDGQRGDGYQEWLLLDELPAGSGTLEPVTLSKKAYNVSGWLDWYDNSLILAQERAKKRQSSLYRIDLDNTSASLFKIGADSGRFGQTYILGNAIIASYPNTGRTKGTGREAAVWAYPKALLPTAFYRVGSVHPYISVALSVAPSGARIHR